MKRKEYRQTYDGIVIGSGQSGKPLATALAKAGWQIAVIERKWVGGSCINYGCTPTKTMVASARMAYLARRSAEFGIETGEMRVNLKEIRRRKTQLVEKMRNNLQKNLEEDENIDLIFGEARFTGNHSLEIHSADGQSFTLLADKIFINTGARPFIPQITGLSGFPYLDSTSIMELDDIPEHLVIIGGGYIGLEFGQMFRRFGSNVTIIQKSNQLVPREDEDMADEITSILKQDGIEIMLNSEVITVHGKQGQCKLEIITPAGKKEYSGTHLLVATGRIPNIDALNLSSTEIKTNSLGYIEVNSRLETGVPGVYAMGDVKGGPEFTHISYDDYRILKGNLLEGKSATTENRMVPYTIFMDPELGRIGITEKEARRQGLEYQVAKMPVKYVARALEMNETRGVMKVLVEKNSGQILGGAILSIFGGELMSLLEVAMMGKLPYTALKNGIFAHPLLSEAFNNLFYKFK